MANLDMQGPYQMSSSVIDQRIQPSKIGNYALGYLSKDNIHFIVCYIGRSDTDLKQRIKDHLNESPKYQLFKFSYANSQDEAFKKECINYHDFGGDKYLENKVHPDAPSGKGGICPVCGYISKIQ